MICGEAFHLSQAPHLTGHFLRLLATVICGDKCRNLHTHNIQSSRISGKEKSAFSSASRPQSVGRDQPCLKSPSMRPACLLLTSAQMRPACLLLTSDLLPAESGCLTGLHNSLSPKSSWEGSPRALLKLSLAQAKTPKLCRRARTVLATRKERKPSWFH